ncbi:MAG: hypothetical protein OXQ89_18935 [Rhodospirillaceae bacterium]|nr:hypothetical protein [Rhodospirillaceae bacterium]
MTTLRAGRDFFPDGQLAPDLRRLQILAQRDSGALPDAIVTATTEFEASPTREALMELARLYFQVGDLKRLAVLARAHRAVPGLLASDYLVLASYLKAEDPHLALPLLRLAIAAGVRDEHITGAFELAHYLAADAEIRPLTSRLASLASNQAAGVRRVGFGDLLRHFTERREQLDDIWSKLRQGSLPLHIFSAVTGLSLSTMFHRAPLLSAASRTGQSAGPLYQRFGGRAAPGPPAAHAADFCLHVDVTALLNAAHLGILSAFEDAFRPLRLPQDVVVALTAMQDSLRPAQPARLARQRRLQQLASTGDLALVHIAPVESRAATDGDVADHVLRLLRYAVSADCLVLDFMPPTSTAPPTPATAVPPHYRRRLRGPHSVLEALHHGVPLSPTEYAAAIRELGPPPTPSSQPTLPPASRLVCGTEVLLLLASAGLLDATTTTFRVAVPSDDFDRHQADVAASDAAQEEAAWIADIVDRIRAGLDSGTYEFLPRMPNPSDAAWVDPAPQLSAALHDVLAADHDDGCLLWIDDRCINSHQRTEHRGIVDTVDLLPHLLHKGGLSQSDLFAVLTRLRAGDARFVAFDPDELLSALHDAPIRDAYLVETARLRVLRQYYARCLLDADALMPPPADPMDAVIHTEWQFLLTCGSALLSALVGVWKNASVDDARARAEWLLRNMYVEDRGLYATGAPRTAQADVYRAAVSIAGLIGSALELDTLDSQRDVRRAYFIWLHQRVLKSRFVVDGAFANLSVDRIKDLVVGRPSNQDSQKAEVSMRLAARLWADLPDELRRLTETDGEFLGQIGATTITVLTIGPLQLCASGLWETLATVVNEGRSATVKTLDGETVNVTLESSEPIVLTFRCEALAIEDSIRNDDFAFLSDSLVVREAAAEKLRDYFDGPAQRREAAVAAVVAGQDPEARMDAAVAARARSGAVFYAEFAAGLRDGAEFRPAGIMPEDCGLLLDHLRLDAAASEVRFDELAEGLRVEIGVVQTVVRFGGLPVRLPDSFVASIVSLTPREQRATRRRLVRALRGSPVGVVQLADLCVRVACGARRKARIARVFIEALCDEGNREVFDGWYAVLCWVYEHLGLDGRWRAERMDVRLMLLWTHADRVFRILVQRGASGKWIAEVFGAPEHLLRVDFVFPELGRPRDIVMPRYVGAESFVLAALAAICLDREFLFLGSKILENRMVSATEAVRGLIVTAMMADTSGATNVLGSWLQRRHDASELLPEPLRGEFADSERRAVIDACENIGADGLDEREWFQLVARVGEYPLREGVAGAVESCLRKVDLVDMCEKRTDLTKLVLRFVSAHAGSLSSREWLREEVVRLARAVGDLDMPEEERIAVGRAAVGALMGSAWAESATDGEVRARELAAALERLVDALAREALEVDGVSLVLLLCDRLPAAQARHFWRVRERLRLEGPL